MSKEDGKTELTPDVRAGLVKENRKQFASVSKEAAGEFDGFAPCEKCRFLGQGCHKTCGILMKQRWKAGTVARA